MKRAYTDSERAELVALAATIGDTGKAAKQLGIPRRTAYHWMTELRQGEGRTSRIIPAETREQVAEKFWQVIQAGAERLVSGMAAPNARLGDVAQATRVAIESHALLTGGATSRNVNLNADVGAAARALTPTQQEELATWMRSLLHASDDELREVAPKILPQIIEAERLATAYQAGDPEAIALLGEGTDSDGLG